MTNREPVDAVSIGIFPLENYEPTELTLLGRHLYKTVAALEAHYATPDETTIAYQAPFGRYNEGGTLAVDLTADVTGLTAGQLAFADPDKHHSFALTLADNRQYWYSRADHSHKIPITHTTWHAYSTARTRLAMIRSYLDGMQPTATQLLPTSRLFLTKQFSLRLILSKFAAMRPTAIMILFSKANSGLVCVLH